MNYFNYIHKQAGSNPVIDAIKSTITKAPAAYYAMLGLAGGTGLIGGHILARTTAPSTVKNNSDKILISEALATEIDVTERRIKDLERRRAALKERKLGAQAYDRFV